MHPIVADDVREILATPLPWDRLDGRTVLVTGAAGFLGSYLVETFLRRDRIRVIGLVRDGDKAAKRFEHHRGRPDLRWLEQDVCDPLPSDLHADLIIHAASQASPKYYGVDPVGTARSNVIGTDHLLRLAQKCKSERLLFVSSSEVYGQVPPDENPIREESTGSVNPTAVRSCYAESKRAGETLCVTYHSQHGVPATIVRPFHTYGPGLTPGDGRVFADFIENVVAGRDIVLTSDGSARRAFCYVSDAVAGFFTVLLQGVPGEAYNVGNEDAESSVRDLAHTLVSLYPEKKLKASFQAPPSSAGYMASAVARNCPDTSKLRKLGWKPRWSIADGFRRAIESAS